MMGYIKNSPRTKMSLLFVRKTFPPKYIPCFRFISLRQLEASRRYKYRQTVTYTDRPRPIISRCTDRPRPINLRNHPKRSKRYLLGISTDRVCLSGIDWHPQKMHQSVPNSQLWHSTDRRTSSFKCSPINFIIFNLSHSHVSTNTSLHYVPSSF